MAEIVNLRLARKRAARNQDEKHASEQRGIHGISKAERERTAAQRNKAHKELDRHRIEPSGDR